MAAPELRQQSSRRRQNRFLVVLLVCAAVVSAARDLGRFNDLTTGVAGLVTYLHQNSPARESSPAAPSCPEALPENDRAGQPYNWNGRIAPDQLAALNQSYGGIDAVPAINDEMALVVIKNSHRDELEPIRIAPAAKRPTIALHSDEAAERPNLVVQIPTVRLRNTDLPKSLKAELPATVRIVERSLNEQIESALTRISRRAVRTSSWSFHNEGRRFYFRRPASVSETQPKTKAALSLVEQTQFDEQAQPKVTVVDATELPCKLARLTVLGAQLEIDEPNDEAVKDSLTLKALIPVTVPAAPDEAEDAH